MLRPPLSPVGPQHKSRHKAAHHHRATHAPRVQCPRRPQQLHARPGDASDADASRLAPASPDRGAHNRRERQKGSDARGKRTSRQPPQHPVASGVAHARPSAHTHPWTGHLHAHAAHTRMLPRVRRGTAPGTAARGTPGCMGPTSLLTHTHSGLAPATSTHMRRPRAARAHHTLTHEAETRCRRDAAPPQHTARPCRGAWHGPSRARLRRDDGASDSGEGHRASGHLGALLW
jgi:hypothetical protein